MTLALFASACVAGSALADDRFVTPTGGEGPCTQAVPCDIETGVNEAASGDTVHVAGDLGPYGGPELSLVAHPGVSVVGEGAQRPRVVLSDNFSSVSLAVGGSAAHLELERVAGTSLTLNMVEGSVASDMKVVATQSLPVQINGLLRDSFVHAIGPTSVPAVQVFGDEAKLVNVTAIADGAGSTAIAVSSFYDILMMKCTVLGNGRLTNVIARGAKFDLAASTAYPSCPAVLNVRHSNYRAGAVQVGPGGAIVDQGGNQTAVEPLLAPDRLHELLVSPTVDAGIVTGETGAIDVDGEPRILGAAPDIGADEVRPPAPPAAPSDAVAPVGTRLRLKPRRFRPKPARPKSIARASARERRRRTPRTSLVSYRLSEDASVRFTVRRRLIGHRKGKRCVIGRKRRASRGRRCRKLVRVRGGFSDQGRSGANRFRFNGYVRGRRLRPGAYRLIGVPTDPAGNRGRRFGARFAIARR